jgi:glycosyltransferase involved in cell wall biosynthesis
MDRSAAGKNICLVMQGSRNWIGGMEYISNLAIALHSFRQSAKGSFKIFLMTTKAVDHESIAHVAESVDGVFYEEDELPALTYPNRALWFVRRVLLRDAFPRWHGFIKRNRIDVIYPTCAARPGPSKPVAIGWIYDFQHKYLPQFFKPWEIKERETGFVNIAQKTQTVVVSSKTAQDDLAEFLPWASGKSRVLSFRSSCQEFWYSHDPLQIQQKYSLPDRFFLVSNQFWQHKNHLIIFAALRILRGKDIHPTVVCTGQLLDYRDPSYSDRILRTISENGLHNQVYLLGLIPKQDQIALTRRCVAVIQPSLFEGWSTLVENARALGKTLILSDIPVHLEQNPRYSIFFKHNDAGDLATHMESVWNSKSPGPDLKKEDEAKSENRELMLEFGRQFASIAIGSPAESRESRLATGRSTSGVLADRAQSTRARTHT